MNYVDLFVELNDLMSKGNMKERVLGWSGWYSLVINLVKKHLVEVDGVGFYMIK
jgi:hypothetical protein